MAAQKKSRRVRQPKPDILVRLASVGTDPSKDLAHNYGEMVDVISDAYGEIERLRNAALHAADLIDRNLYHQREKVVDASALLRQALNHQD